MTTARLSPGDLLVAVPDLSDPNFKRGVVLVLDHDEDGALGVVLNHPLDVPVGTVLPGWDDVVSQPARLFQGGPVGLDGALGVATLPAGVDPPPAVTRIAGAFGLVDLDSDPAAARGLLGLRVFAGHAGWSPGQLDAEMGQDAWIVLESEPDDLFSPDDLWPRVVQRKGGEFALMTTMPLDPKLN